MQIFLELVTFSRTNVKTQISDKTFTNFTKSSIAGKEKLDVSGRLIHRPQNFTDWSWFF